jgi:hypothetical protein
MPRRCGGCWRGCRPRDARLTPPLPTPWQAERLLGGYVIRDASGQALAYVYSRDTEAEARKAKVLTADEARRIAVNIAAAGAVGESSTRRRGRAPEVCEPFAALANCRHDNRSPVGPPCPEHPLQGAIRTRQPNCC